MVTKPTPGTTGWNVAVDEVIDIANSVADLPDRVTALEAGGGDVTEAELAAGLATKAAAVHNHTDLLDQAAGDNRYVLQANANAFAQADATTTALAGKQPLDADLTALAGLDSATAGTVASDGAGWVKKTYAQMRTALGLAPIATSGKLADATDVTTTGAAVGQHVAVAQVGGDGKASAFGLALPVFSVPAPTGVAATDTAAIIARAQAASVAGGGVVSFPGKRYILTQALPLLPGVKYQGVPPVLQADVTTPGSYMPDFESTFVNGTVLQGDGTFPAFAANIVDQGSAAADWGAAQISGAGIYGFGLDTFSYGIQAGATNVMGLVYSTIDEVYVRGCTQWGVKLVNFQHVNMGVIRVWSSTHGIYLASETAWSTLIPGNSQARELFVKVKYSNGALNKSRGIVIGGFVDPLAQLGGMDVDKLQVNAFNRPLTSVTATFTNASTGVTVPDGSVFAVGMPVQFTATGNGFTANKIYFIRSISGNTLTFGTSTTDTVITASAGGTLTMQTRGFPNAEFVAMGSSRMHDIDVEGDATVAVYAERTNYIDYSIATVPANCLVELVARSSTYCKWYSSSGGTKTDFDSGSTTGSQFFGGRNATYGRPLPGLWIDTLAATNGLKIANGTDQDGTPDLQVRAQGMLYPAAAGMGEHVRVQDSNLTLSGAHVGNVWATGTSSPTYTLPTILTQTTPGASQVGMWFLFANTGTGTITVNTGGSQLFNRIAAKTSLAIAAGQALKVVACQDTQMFWLAYPVALAT